MCAVPACVQVKVRPLYTNPETAPLEQQAAGTPAPAEPSLDPIRVQVRPCHASHGRGQCREATRLGRGTAWEVAAKATK
jgi:hypothetical protein